ncbi:DUF4252 domain-containing protein [Ulvibacter sp.]|nr:DUF4252 domain-containing protein [Ulvibacter sp.]
MGLTKYLIPFAVAFLALVSCGNEPSLQKYLVAKQEDDKFMKIDLAASLLQSEGSSFTEEQQDVLKTIKKVNVVAYKVEEENLDAYAIEKEIVSEIMSQDKYKTLMRFGSNTRGTTLKYLGEEDAIDELIVFASDSEKGFAVFRLLGENMRPDQMMTLMSSIENGDLDLSKFSGLGDLLEF